MAKKNSGARAVRLATEKPPLVVGICVATLAGFGLGFAAAFGFALAKPGIERSFALGSMGEWVGGLGAFLAAVVALRVAEQSERERREVRAQEAVVVAAYIEGPLTDIDELVSSVRALVDDWLEMKNEAAPLPVGLLEAMKDLYSRAPAKWFRENLSKLTVLPNGGGKALASSLYILDKLLDDLPAAIRLAETQLAYAFPGELQDALLNVAGWCEPLADGLNTAIDSVRVAQGHEVVPTVEIKKEGAKVRL